MRCVFYRFIYGFRCFGIRFVRFGTRFGGFGVVFRRFECLKTVLYIREAAEVRLGVPKWLWVRGFAWRVAAVMWLVFFIFYVLFAGIRLRMWCFRLAMRQKCGVKCRNGCGFWGLRGGLRRLPVAVSGLSVVVLGFVVMFGRFPVGNGGLRVGNLGFAWCVCFVFGLKKEGDVSRRSHAKENIRRFQARLTFLYFVFRCLRGAKVVFFCLFRVFSW